MSNAPSKPVSFSRPKVGYFSNRPRIYIFIAFYILLKYCTDGPMVIVNYRNMKLILNKGSRVPDSKRYVFKQCTNTTGSTPFHFTLCIQCAEYIDRKRVYKGMMTTHQNNHLHIFETSPCQSVHNLSKVWLHHPLTPSIHPKTFLNHPQILCCRQETASPFFMTADSHKTLFNHLCDFFQKPQIFLSLLINN